MLKYRKHKQSASSVCVEKAKSLGKLGVHPMLVESVSEEEKSTRQVRDILNEFRPKTNAIEL